jgi:site-specific recombinase XerC
MRGRKKLKCLLPTELQMLLSYVKSQADSARERGTMRAIVDELVVLLLTRAGLRANEISALKLEDLPTGHGENSLWIRNVKGKVLRKVDISEDFARLLTRFVRLYRKGAKKNDSLLETERGNPFGYMSLYSKVRRIGEQAGIGKLNPNILRYTYIVRLYEEVQDLRYVQEQTGYTSRRTLAKYLRKDSRKNMSSKKVDTKLTKQGSVKQKSRLLGPAEICEACGTTTAHGRRIESGQFICHECLKYFSAD